MTHKALALLSCATLTLFQINSHANDSEQIEQVFITSAQKRDEQINSVPIALEIYDSAFIEAANAQALSDLEFVIPSVNFGRGGRKTRGEIAIRGVGDFSRNIGVDARVAVYIDDVPLGRSSAFDSNLLDIQQIEILKGPQGTLFGTNTIAGAINIITTGPKDKRYNKLRTEFGNLGHRLMSLSTHMPFSETTSGLVQLGSIKSDGFIKNTVLNTTLQGDDSRSARIKLRHTPSDRLSITTNFDWLTEDVHATNAMALADLGFFTGFSSAPSAREVAHDALEFEDREIWGSSLVLNYTMSSGHEVKSISAFRSSQFEELSEEDYSPISAVTSTFDEQYRQWTQELRLVSKEYERFNYVVGTFLSISETKSERKATLSGIDALTPGVLDSEAYSVFVNGNYLLNSWLSINGGIRIQSEQKDIDYEIDDATGNFPSGSLTDDENFKSVLPRLSINFHLPDEALIYTSISRGTKSGGWNADFVASLNDISFKSEYATNYEAGYKQLLLDNRLNINLSTFLTKYTDFQVFQFIRSGSTSIIQLTNAGEATSKGIELNTSMKIGNNTSVSLNGAYTDASFDRFENGNESGDDFSGNKLPYAPELTAYLAVDGNFSPPRVDSLFYQLSYTYSDGYFSNPSNSQVYEVDQFYTVNAHIGAEINSHWSVSIWGKNITDETFLRSRDISFLTIQRGYYEAPRSYGVSMTFRN